MRKILLSLLVSLSLVVAPAVSQANAYLSQSGDGNNPSIVFRWGDRGYAPPAAYIGGYIVYRGNTPGVSADLSPALANDPMFQRGAELWAVGLWPEARAPGAAARHPQCPAARPPRSPRPAANRSAGRPYPDRGEQQARGSSEHLPLHTGAMAAS